MEVNGPDAEKEVPSDRLRSGLAGRSILIVEDDVALPTEFLMPYPAEEMQTWRLGEDAKSSRIEPHVGMGEAVAG